MPNADQIIELLHEAKARPAGVERERFLAEACGDDAALREQVVSLLEAEANDSGSFLQRTPFAPPPAPVTEKPGDRIGRYKLLEQIGEGGCGVVYMAEQEEPVRRRVALKVIKLGMDTKQVIARFEAERQALAMMDHPNIAKVLDGGATDTGRPFFVMELVRGIKITDYCDQNNLSTNERLELFMQVCQAIQHAHQKGIIHRDIKPSNILVTQHDDVAVPKVIDFGIAKATTGQLTDKTLFTAFAQFIGTPAYMSPEQAQMSGLDIDTRADIYSLGVLLYELLTGNTPFDAKELMVAGLDEMRRKIREDEPAKPSTCLSTMQAMDLKTVAKNRHVEPPRLIHLIRGDPDWIVMKCLEKDRTRRYETANGPAADIQRYLSNELITARPPSRLYEFQKTVRRHKFGFAAAAALIIVLGLGVFASTWQALRATHAEREQIRLRKEAERDKKSAQTQAAKSQQVAQFMQDMLKGVGPSAALGRDTTMLREILDKTTKRIAADLKNQPDVEAELRHTIGKVYWELGAYDEAGAMHLQALAIQRKLVGNEHPSVATSLHYLARALREQGKLAESEAAYRESLAMRRKLLGIEHSDIARSLNDLGSLLSIELKNDEPEALLREALAIRRRLHGNEHGEVARSLDDLAHVLNRRGQVSEAVAMHYEALAIRKRVLGDMHPELIYSYMNLAGALRGQGTLAEAEALCREALARRLKLFGNEHPEMAVSRGLLFNLVMAQGKWGEVEVMCREDVAAKKKRFGNVHREVGNALVPLAQVLHKQHKMADAEAIWREELEIEKTLSGSEHPFVANSLHSLAVVLLDSRQLDEAEKVFRETLALRRKLLPAEDSSVASSVLWLAGVVEERGDLVEAESLYREHVALKRNVFGAAHLEVAASLARLSMTLLVQEKFTEAEATARECLEIREKKLPDDWRTFNARSILGAGLLRQKKYAEAEPLLTSGYAGMKQRVEKIPTAGKRHVKSTIERLVQLYDATGQSEKAAQWNKTLAEFDRTEAGKKSGVTEP